MARIVGANPSSPAEQVRIQAPHLARRLVTESSFASYNGYAASIPANKVADLAHDTASKHMVPDRRVMPAMDVALPTNGGSSPGASPAVGLNLLRRVDVLVDAITSPTGDGVTVAVIDSGIGVNPDLKTTLGVDRVVVRWSAMQGSLTDEFGHGTHVAGIISGNAKSSSGPYALRTFRGVAPNVRFVSLKVLGDDGTGEVSNVLSAVD
jgi:serine protease AprX